MKNILLKPYQNTFPKDFLFDRKVLSQEKLKKKAKKLFKKNILA